MVGVEGFEPSEWMSQSHLPYHLATPQYWTAGKKPQAPPEARLKEKNGVDEGIRTLGLQSHNLAR